MKEDKNHKHEDKNQTNFPACDDWFNPSDEFIFIDCEVETSSGDALADSDSVQVVLDWTVITNASLKSVTLCLRLYVTSSH